MIFGNKKAAIQIVDSKICRPAVKSKTSKSDKFFSLPLPIVTRRDV